MVSPRFSVVVPAYNAASTIDDTIRSVREQVDFDAWELIVVDDGSTDETGAIAWRHAAADPRVRVLHQQNAGTGAAIATGVASATGEYVVQLGADDALLPQYCSMTSAFIDEHPGYDIYASNAYRLFPDGSRELYHAGSRWQRVFSLTVDDMIEACQIHGTAAFRRTVFDEVGGFRPGFYNEDYDFWLRAMMAGAKHIYQPAPLALYRVREGQKTSDGVRMREGDIAILRDAVASGRLNPRQAERARGIIRMLKRNVLFRRVVLALFGERLAQPVFQVAHSFAWLFRPHRRVR